MRILLHRAITITAVITTVLFIITRFNADDDADRQERVKGLDGQPSPRDVPIGIQIFEYGFNPSRTVIKVGQAVAFRNIGSELHHIQPLSPQGEVFFQAADRAGSTRPVFTVPGVYRVYCTIHPRMKAKIDVREHLAPLEDVE